MDHEERHHQSFEMSPLFVGILAILSGALVVATLHCTIIGWCNSRRRSPSPQNRTRIARAGREESMLSSTSTSNSAGSDKLVVIYKYSDVEEDKEGTCAVCLSEFAEGEEVRILPECAHSFHLACIDVWLHSHPNCPLCRADAAPPLQHVVVSSPDSGGFPPPEL